MTDDGPTEPLSPDERHRLLLAAALELPELWSWELLLDAVRSRVEAFGEVASDNARLRASPDGAS